MEYQCFHWSTNGYRIFNEIHLFKEILDVRFQNSFYDINDLLITLNMCVYFHEPFWENICELSKISRDFSISHIYPVNEQVWIWRFGGKVRLFALYFWLIRIYIDRVLYDFLPLLH